MYINIYTYTCVNHIYELYIPLNLMINSCSNRQNYTSNLVVHCGFKTIICLTVYVMSPFI